MQKREVQALDNEHNYSDLKDPGQRDTQDCWLHFMLPQEEQTRVISIKFSASAWQCGA